MTDSIRCPDCGASNPPDAASCAHCNFPLAPAAAEPPPAKGPRPEPSIPRSPPRPRRRPPRASGAGQALSLWLFVGGFAALLLVFMGIKAGVDRSSEPVEGSNEAQQKRADELQATLAKDSTDVDTRQALADLYYDTGNWSEASTHYRSVLRRDSTRVTAIVDLGVCYYNLGVTDRAETLFQLALRRDPHQPVALFNLGIVSERRDDYDAALRYYHAAIQSAPPEEMGKALIEAMQRVQQKTGRTPPPLNQGP